MATTIINLTFLKVNSEIDNLLSTYPALTHQKLLTDPDLRQRLLAYVLSSINNHYIAIDTEKVSSISSQSISCSTQEKLKIEELIQQAIYQLVSSENNRYVPCVPGTSNSTYWYSDRLIPRTSNSTYWYSDG